MRFKYYLRGIGIGVTLATLLLTVSFYFGRDYLYKNELSDEEIIEQAAALGMVMPEETDDESGQIEDENPAIEETENIEDTDEVATEEDKTEAIIDAADKSYASSTKKVEEAEVPLASTETETSSEDTVTYVPFTVRGGESSEVICSHLKQAGLIDDSEAFNKYLHKCKVDDKIPNGTFYVKQGSSYDDIVAVLINKDVRTTTPPKN